MKKIGLRGTVGALALAMSLVGGTALAGGDAYGGSGDHKDKQHQTEEQKSEGTGGSGQSDEPLIDPVSPDVDTGVDATDLGTGVIDEPEQEGTGGSGEPQKDQKQQKHQQEGTGGSGQAEEPEQPDEFGIESGWDATDIGPVLDNDPPGEEGTGGSGIPPGVTPESRSSETEGLIDATEAQEEFGLEENTQVRVSGHLGLGDYTGDVASVTGLGTTFGVRAGAQQYDVVGLELGYGGSRNPLDDARVEDGAAVWRHGVDALVKLGPTLESNVRPFFGAGFGVSYLNANEEAEPLFNNDIMTQIPLAVGVELDRGSINAGVRATYEILMNEEFAEDAVAASDGNYLTGQITIGGQF